MIRILVTAFGAFPGAPSNPTIAVAHRLERRRRALALAGIDIVTTVLPVHFEGTQERLEQLLAEIAPDAVLHLGLAGRRRKISVETRALNRLSILRAGSDRRVSATMVATPGGPFQRRSRYDAPALARTISNGGADAGLSIDAGDYLCNQTLYLSLAMHELPCGFIHIPSPRRRRRRNVPTGGRSRPTLAQIASGIEAAVRELAKSVFLRH